MERIFVAVLTLYGLFVSCLALPTEIEADTVNCTVIGVATTCCESHGCAFINCTDAVKCEDARNTSAWGDTCQTAVNQCLDILAQTNGNGTTFEPGFNGTSSLPLTTFSDSSTPSTKTPVTLPTVSNHSVTTENASIFTFEPVSNFTIIQPNVTVTTSVEPTRSGNTTVTDITTTVVKEMTNSTSADTGSEQTNTVCKRHFDAASFIGGMVFLLGIAAIGGFVCVYYRSQHDTSYRML